MKRKWMFVCIVIMGLSAGLFYLQRKEQWLVHPVGVQKVEIVKESDIQGGMSRNAFSQKVGDKPYQLRWAANDFFYHVLEVLEQPQKSIIEIFAGNISKLPDDEYYAGAYNLDDDLYCPLLWISNNDQLSLGYQLQGSVATIQQGSFGLFGYLGEPTKQEETYKQQKYYWMDKTYRGMKYFIECDQSITDAGEGLLTIVIHPQIYH
jgi:hypothetical protein